MRILPRVQVVLSIIVLCISAVILVYLLMSGIGDIIGTINSQNTNIKTIVLGLGKMMCSSLSYIVYWCGIWAVEKLGYCD